jgi:hypothetical protein
MSFALPILRYSLAWMDSDPTPAKRSLIARMTSPDEAKSAEKRARANAALIRRMAGGDRDALAELYDNLSRPLYATARHILNDAA